MTRACDLSVIVVVGSRYDDIRTLFLCYWEDLGALDLEFEMIYVIDGPRSVAGRELKHLQDEGYPIRIVQLARAFGEATGLTCGFDHAGGRLIMTLPAYHQVARGELPKLVQAHDKCDMAVARRWPRRGNAFETLRRRFFHGLLRWVTGYRFSDLGCGVRLLDRRILEELRLYGDQHRFLPALASNNGFRVVEIDLAQSASDEFRGHYRVREYLHRLLDIFTVFFLVRFTKKPLRFFGMIGSLLLAIGGSVLVVIVFQRLFLDQALADRPALLLSSLLVVLGLQVISLGLLGELIIFTHAPALKEYSVAEIIEQSPPNESDSPIPTSLNR